MLDEARLTRLNTGTPESIFLYPYHLHRDKVRFDAGWYTEQRAKAAGVIDRHVRVRAEILDEVDAFHTAHLAGRHSLGVHLRGTDKRQVGRPASTTCWPLCRGRCAADWDGSSKRG